MAGLLTGIQILNARVTYLDHGMPWLERTILTHLLPPSRTGSASRQLSAVDEPGGLESSAGGVHRFAALDGIRGLAAMAVVMTHVGFQTGQGLTGSSRGLLSRLDVGVALFFVLSGFLLHRPQVLARMTHRPRARVGHYLWRRALRVLPAFWVVTVLALVVLPDNRDLPVTEWLWQLGFASIYAAEHQQPGLTQMWSVSTEVSFYLVLPLLGRLSLGRAGRGPKDDDVRSVLRTQLWWCAGLTVVALAWQQLVASGGLASYAGYWLPAHLDWFAVGMALAAFSAARSLDPTVGPARLDELARESGTWALAALALFLLVSTPLGGRYGLVGLSPAQTAFRSITYSLVALLLVAPAVLGRPRRRAFLESPPLQALGRVSYGLFLVHLVAIDLAFRVLGIQPFSGHFLVMTVVSVSLSLIAATLSYVVVETPALRLRSWGPGRTARD